METEEHGHSALYVLQLGYGECGVGWSIVRVLVLWRAHAASSTGCTKGTSREVLLGSIGGEFEGIPCVVDEEGGVFEEGGGGELLCAETAHLGFKDVSEIGLGLKGKNGLKKRCTVW